MDQSIQSYLKPELDEASKVLLRAADYIEEHGWCQNEMHTLDGSACLEGAIQYAISGRLMRFDEGLESANLFCDALTRIDLAVDRPAFKWNDAPGRTKEEVVAKLREVALGGA